MSAQEENLENMLHCIHSCNIQVDEFVPPAIACAEAVLDEFEKENSVLLLDMGAGITDAVVYSKGILLNAFTIGMGGKQITSDIAEALRSACMVAERIKHIHGYALASRISEHESIDIPLHPERAKPKFFRKELAQIIETRCREIFSGVDREMTNAGIKSKSLSKIVITGGGSLLNGITDLAEEVFGIPASMGIPRRIGGEASIIHNPIHSTGIGLAVWASKAQAKLKAA